MLIILIAFLQLRAHAEAPNPPRAGQFEARGTYSFFTTDTNYSSDSADSLVGEGTFTNMTGELMAHYDWRPDWRFSGGANFSWVESDDGVETRTNSGVNEMILSAQKWYESGPFDFAPQIDFIYPLWRVDENADEALIGEGALRARGGAWAFWPLGGYKPFGYVGFEYRDGGRAYLLPYSVGVKVRIEKFWIQGDFRGYETVVDDADTDNEAIRQSYLDSVNAGSFRFYPINPASSEVALEAGTRFGNFGIFAGFSITVAGKNSADGWTGYGGLSFYPNVTGNASSSRAEGFHIRREKYDENLFRDERADEFVEDPQFKPPTPAPPVDAPPVETRPRSRPVENSKSPSVDIQLELRRVPPKKKKKPVAPKRKKKIDTMMNDAESALENAN